MLVFESQPVANHYMETLGHPIAPSYLRLPSQIELSLVLQFVLMDDRDWRKSLLIYVVVKDGTSPSFV